MDLSVPPEFAAELPAALLQTAVTLALALLLGSAYGRLGKPYLRWWCLTWCLYVVRMGAILAFAFSEAPVWLYWHQVLTGWTALGLVGGAVAFSQPQRSLRWLGWLAVFPPVWSWVAIYQMDEFLLAAAPAVLFLSVATLIAAAAFIAHNRRVGSPAALFLGIVLGLWALHHLDYPFLRARGAWAPWGYFLDILFKGAVGFGLFTLMLEDFRSGMESLFSLSARVREPLAKEKIVASLLDAVGQLPGVEGTALVSSGAGAASVLASTGSLSGEAGAGLVKGLEVGLVSGKTSAGNGIVRLSRESTGLSKGAPSGTWIPVRRTEESTLGLLVAGGARHGLAALDDRYLVAIGDQIGSALEEADLRERLVARTEQLERLSASMVKTHEAERARLSRELHDETAQALAAVRVRLSLLREEIGHLPSEALDEVEGALGGAIKSIRRVTSRLRPAVLDELGLVPALRALVRDFPGADQRRIEFQVAGTPKRLSPEHELTIFRALQEGLSNVVRHTEASTVDVVLEFGAGSVVLSVSDNGGSTSEGLPAEGGLGLAGMRERVVALGGTVGLDPGPDGTCLRVTLPATADWGEAAESTDIDDGVRRSEGEEDG